MPTLLQHIDGDLAGFFFGDLAVRHDLLRHLVADLFDRDQAVQAHRFADVRAGGVDRRQRAHRLLEDHADLAAADFADRLSIRVELGDVDDVDLC